MATNCAMRALTSKCIPGGRTRGATSEPVPPISTTAIPGQGTGGSSVIALSLSTTDSTSPLPGPTSRALLQDPCIGLLEDPGLCLHDAITKNSDSHMNLFFCDTVVHTDCEQVSSKIVKMPLHLCNPSKDPLQGSFKAPANTASGLSGPPWCNDSAQHTHTAAVPHPGGCHFECQTQPPTRLSCPPGSWPAHSFGEYPW